ncbi:hypothetical protein BC829DRAFT_399114 [Chytridium lagenaria]|nr:hypothetical protein BC829DRAFT_399114 [Chytridium lagenaria]
MSVLLNLHHWSDTVAFDITRVQLTLDDRIQFAVPQQPEGTKFYLSMKDPKRGMIKQLLIDNGNGYSTHKFQPDETYNIYIKTATSADVDISFSESTWKGLSKDFDMTQGKTYFSSTHFEFDIDTVPPQELHRAILACARQNNSQFQERCRDVVPLFVALVAQEVDKGRGTTRVDETYKLEATRQTQQGGVPYRVRYHGHVDIVVGHSSMPGNELEDLGVLVSLVPPTEFQFSKYVERSEHRAQGAAALEARNQKYGNLTSSVFLVYTDGDMWIFTKMTMKDNKIETGLPSSYKLARGDSEFDTGNLAKIYWYLRECISESRDTWQKFSQEILLP